MPKKAIKMESGGATIRSKRHRDAYRRTEKMAKGGPTKLGCNKRGRRQARYKG